MKKYNVNVNGTMYEVEIELMSESEAKTAPAPKAEPVAKPEPKIDSVPAPTEIDFNDLKEADESTKKTSFFDRLFGRK